MNEPLLQVRNLNVTYMHESDEVKAVRDISFSVSPGSVLAILGGSGAGKSSIALALPGLHERAVAEVTGEVMFCGRDILLMDEGQLDSLRGREIGMMFQDPRRSLDPTMKVENQVAEAVRLHHGLSRDEALVDARSRLASVGVSERLLQDAPYAHQLSSGLCQRAMMAIALTGDPELLIADEPTGSLDLTRQAQIISLLKERQADTGLAMVFITHDLGLAAAVADELLIVHEGEAVDYGSCETVMKSPGHPYSASMLSAWRDGFSLGDG